LPVITTQGSRSLVDVLYEDIIPKLSIEDAYPSVSFEARRGRHWRGGCPLHGGDDPNFSVDTQTLSWTCFSHFGHGSFLAYLNGGETPRGPRFLEFVKVLAYRVGVSGPASKILSGRRLSHELGGGRRHTQGPRVGG